MRLARDPDGSDHAAFGRSPDLGGLEYLHAHYVTHTFAPHTHEGFAIGVVERGVGAFALEGATRVAPAGTVVAIDPEQAHTGGPYRSHDLTYYMLYPPASLVRSVAGELGGPVSGLVITSIAFGLGHVVQGWDAVIVTGLLGAFWGTLYVVRHSIVAAVVSHALANGVQVLIAFAQGQPVVSGS